MRKLFAALLLALVAAAPALASETGNLQAKLKAYDKLKKREATLKIVIPRATPAQGEKYQIEYDKLKPKLYAAAEAMEHAVAQYEQKHGRKAMCAAVPAIYKKHVPACSH